MCRKKYMLIPDTNNSNGMTSFRFKSKWANTRGHTSPKFRIATVSMLGWNCVPLFISQPKFNIDQLEIKIEIIITTRTTKIVGFIAYRQLITRKITAKNKTSGSTTPTISESKRGGV